MPLIKRLKQTLMMSSLLMLGACSAPLVLDSKSSAVPPGIDLSGNWVLRAGSGTVPQSGVPGIEEPPLVLSRTSRQQRIRSQSSGKGASVHVFLEFGESLKVTQTEYSLFISYDRSVVEEYTFGENRMVNVGPIEALRVSGWEGNAFVVETLDRTRTTLFEKWRLEDDGTVLVRDIRISNDDKNRFTRKQYFDRS